jgi:hypothetical protein
VEDIGKYQEVGRMTKKIPYQAPENKVGVLQSSEGR